MTQPSREELLSLETRLREHAIRYAADYGYSVADDLISAANVLLGVAQAPCASPQEVQEACAQVADRAADADDAYAVKYPDEVRKCANRAHRARTIANSIRALIPPISPVSSTNCVCDMDHPLFKERGHHPHCPASTPRLETMTFDDVDCKQATCEWPECECPKRPKGGFACPHCGTESPHHHSEAEIALRKEALRKYYAGTDHHPVYRRIFIDGGLFALSAVSSTHSNGAEKTDGGQS